MSLLPMNVLAANDRIFGEVANLPGVESVYIGPAALRLAMKSLPTEGKLVDGLGGAIRELKSVEVIECDNRKSIDKIEKFARGLIDSLSLEVIVEATENDEKTRIYGIVPEGGKENTINALLIESREKDEYTLVYIRGVIDLTEIGMGDE